jgi:hypothetical protein
MFTIELFAVMSLYSVLRSKELMSETVTLRLYFALMMEFMAAIVYYVFSNAVDILT